MDLSKIRLTYTEPDGIHKKLGGEIRKFVQQKKLAKDQREFVKHQRDRAKDQRQQAEKERDQKKSPMTLTEYQKEKYLVDSGKLQFISDYQREKYVDEWCSDPRNEFPATGAQQHQFKKDLSGANATSSMRASRGSSFDSRKPIIRLPTQQQAVTRSHSARESKTGEPKRSKPKMAKIASPPRSPTYKTPAAVLMSGQGDKLLRAGEVIPNLCCGGVPTAKVIGKSLKKL